MPAVTAVSNLGALTASQASTILRRGEISVEDYARACLDRIAIRERVLHGWAFIDPDFVVAEARRLDRCPTKGPLHGLPVGIKDVIATRDMPTQCNSEIYKGANPNVDAACVSILRSAGALIFGKTETVELAATGRVPPTTNPHDPARTPGGSSSGSAAVVADFHVPLSLGTQTGGSIIRPASFCGVFALKPTWGLVSREGAKAFAPSLDTIGWFARGAADLLLLCEVFDAEFVEPAPFIIAGSRIGLCRSPFWPLADDATQAAIETASAALSAAGANVVDLTLPAPFAELGRLQGLIMRAEGCSSFLAEYRMDAAKLHASLRAQVENADRISRQDLCAAYDCAAVCRSAFDVLARGFDVVLTPSTPGEAPLGLSHTGDMTFNAMWSLLHTPCVNIPLFKGPAGLPVGLTLTGPRYSDRRVLAAAQAMETLFAINPAA